MTVQLIIFDCDGVLVDSEPIVNEIFHKMLNEAGVFISYEETCQTFTGLATQSCIDFIEQTASKKLPENFETRYRDKCLEVLRVNLKPIKGIHSALDNIRQPICVASGSNHERIKLSLEVTGLLPKFNNIFSVSDVAHGKPAPDLFLYVAQQMGYAPENCAVIEDSIPGVQAGIAAGMTVFAYTGAQKAEALRKAGAHFIFDDMHILPTLLLPAEI